MASAYSHKKGGTSQFEGVGLLAARSFFGLLG